MIAMVTRNGRFAIPSIASSPSGASMARCTTTWPTVSLRPYNQVASAMGRSDMGFLRTRGFVCYQRQCPAVVGHTIVWRDNNHLTWLYSAQVADAFRAAFARARSR